MIANKEIFCLQTTNGNELEDAAYEEAKKYANKNQILQLNMPLMNLIIGKPQNTLKMV